MLRVDSTIEGYAYNTRGASPRIAIAFLLTYCAVALAHLLYAGITGNIFFFTSLYLSFPSPRDLEPD